MECRAGQGRAELARLCAAVIGQKLLKATPTSLIASASVCILILGPNGSPWGHDAKTGTRDFWVPEEEARREVESGPRAQILLPIPVRGWVAN